MGDPFVQLSNIELERTLIHAIHVWPDNIQLIDVDDEDFYDHRHRVIYRTMREMHKGGEAIDLETLNNRLVGNKDLDKAGGFAYLIDIFSMLGVYGKPEDYAPPLIDLSTRRKAFRTAQEMARSVMDRSRPINETINEYSAKIPKLVKVADGARHISYYVSRHYDRLSEADKDPEQARRRILETKFLDFDRATLGGLRLGELLLVLGKPGLGKTKWVHQLAAQLARNGHPGAVFQCETSEEEIMDREFSRVTHIPTERLEVANLYAEEWPVYTHAVEEMSDHDNGLYMHFGPIWNTVTLRAELTRLKAEHDIQFFVFDYLRFLNDKYGKDETERENYISTQLKTICNQLDLSGIVIHSMNKAGISSDSPDMEHSSGGAGISFDCDKALFMTKHIPAKDGDPVYPDYRTFVFRKSRRKVAFVAFEMQAMKDYPAFVDIAKPDDGKDAQPAAQRPSTRRSSKPAAVTEPEWDSDEEELEF
jgi:replicative DNA helicase